MPDHGGDGGRDADLRYVLQCIASQWPYDSSVILNELINRLPTHTAEKWETEGLTGDLKMLVEHYLVWVPLKGRPGERRVITVSRDWELLPKSLLHWKIGPVGKASNADSPEGVSRPRLATGKTSYGRLARRMSFDVLGERLAQPLAWMPIEFDFPTIYTRRCSSYHFEMICPNGLSPHDIKVAIDRPGSAQKRTEVQGSETVDTRVAEVYLPGGREWGDLLIRATVGLGRGAFPVLWFLMGAITSVMLWTFVFANPIELIGAKDSSNEIAAGILLVVPALLGALIAGAEQGATTTRLISGSRLLLLACGLSSALAATVLLGREPFGLSPRAQWTICASIATATMVPLATSWLLSLRMVWTRLKGLSPARKQRRVLYLLIAIAFSFVLALQHVGDHEVHRIVLAVPLVILTVPMILVASNRSAVPMDERRGFVGLIAFLAGLICLLLGCAELRAAVDEKAEFHSFAEWLGLGGLLLVPFVAPLVSYSTSLFHARPGEVHVAPAVGRSLLAGKRIRELHKLRPTLHDVRRRELSQEHESPAGKDEPRASIPMDRSVVEEPIGDSVADWSTGLRSTSELPQYEPGEFDFLVNRTLRSRPDPGQEEEEAEIRGRLARHMQQLPFKRY